MKPVEFKECNIKFAENQDEYNTLPAFKENSPRGNVVTCWRLSFKERVRVLFLGNIWLNLLSFNKPLTPSFMTTKKSDVFELPKFSIRKYFKIKK